MNDRGMRLLLLASVFTIATCGLIYELIASTVASYLLGDSVTQFSTIIGAYLFAMGIGSWLSRYVEKDLLRLIHPGGIPDRALRRHGRRRCSSSCLPTSARFGSFFTLVVLVIGTLVGLEIPLLLRILEGRLQFKDLISKVFTFDYIGALLASLLVPAGPGPLLRPRALGISLRIFEWRGRARGSVGIARSGPRRPLLVVQGVAVLALLAAGFACSERIITWSEAAAYGEDSDFREIDALSADHHHARRR